jgi:hypothetical protein
MTLRRIIAAVVSAAAVFAFNVGTAESASAGKGTGWNIDGKSSSKTQQMGGTAWS